MAGFRVGSVPVRNGAGGNMLGGVPAKTSAGMKKQIGFDNEHYLDEQSNYIIKCAEQFQNKLYLEFGGKLVGDYHAARILPGFDPDVKFRLLQRLGERIEILLCIGAGDIARKKIRTDLGISYDEDILREIDNFREKGLLVTGVVITFFDDQPAAMQFRNKLKRRGVRTYFHRSIPGYPADVDTIVSPAGYGINPFIETTKPIVVISAPGPSSGKMGTCLSQMYHDHSRGLASGYAKFETFPIWNLSLDHPVNLAYEAATADIGDFNVIDQFHLDAYGEKAVNYNRDMEIFPLLRTVLEKIKGTESLYKSPTDMGVNRAGFAITDDVVVREAATQEVVRRYFQYECDYVNGKVTRDTIERLEGLMAKLGVKPEYRPIVVPARQAAEKGKKLKKGYDGIFCGAAMQLHNGETITGSNSALFHASAALVLNAIKKLANLPDPLHLLSPNIIDSIIHLKLTLLHGSSPSLDLEEVLVALSVSAPNNPAVALAIEQLPLLRGCEAHLTHIAAPGDEAGFRRLGVRLTCDSNFASRKLFDQ